MSKRNRRERDVYNRFNLSEKDAEDWISSVLRCLIQNGNRMELEKLQKKVEDKHRKKYPDFETEIKRYSNIFRMDESDTANKGEEEEGVLRDIIVSGKTEVRLCEKHCSTAGSCSSVECMSLHMCRFYILNVCPFDFDQCLFGHDIRKDHNVRVLQRHLLHELGPVDLGHLLRDVRNRNETTMPTICNFYNVQKGCSREDCQFLHLCKRFVKADCKFGLKCKRSHNYFEEQPAQVFKRYGIVNKHDAEKVIELIRKTLDENTPARVAAGVKQNCFTTLVNVKYPSSSQRQSNRYANEKVAAFEDNNICLKSYSSGINAPRRITTKAIYRRSLAQSDNSYRSDDEQDSDTYNRDDSRRVVIDDGYQTKRNCHGESLLNTKRRFIPMDSKTQQNETHGNHIKEGSYFEDISSDEDDKPSEHVATTLMMQDYIPLNTDQVCSPKETQKNVRDIKSQSGRQTQAIDKKETKKPSYPTSPPVSAECAILKHETMGCSGIKAKLENHSLSLVENQRNENQIKSKPKKRAFQPNADKNDEEKNVSAEILNSITDLIHTRGELAVKEEVQNEIHKEDTAIIGSKSRLQEHIPTGLRIFRSAKSNNPEEVLVIDHEYKQAEGDNSTENSEKPGATNFALNYHIFNSEESKKKDSAEGCVLNYSQEIQDTHSEDSRHKPESISDDKLENVEETPRSTLAKEDKDHDGPLGKRELKMKRVIAKNRKPQWMCYFVDTWTSLNMDSEMQDKLEKSYQLFQQSRKCFIEASGSRLHVDFMTMYGKILDNRREQQDQ